MIDAGLGQALGSEAFNAQDVVQHLGNLACTHARRRCERLDNFGSVPGGGLSAGAWFRGGFNADKLEPMDSDSRQLARLSGERGSSLILFAARVDQ